MRREDIALRDAARQGHSRACLAMAGKLFCGNDGLARNYRLGLAYLQQELNRQSPAARLLAAEAVPVDILAAHQLLDVLPARSRA
jgi:TPR repeat protein